MAPKSQKSSKTNGESHKKKEIEAFLTNLQHKFWNVKRFYLKLTSHQLSKQNLDSDIEVNEQIEKYYRIVQTNTSLETILFDLCHTYNKLNRTDSAMQKFLKKHQNSTNEVVSKGCMEMCEMLEKESQSRDTLKAIIDSFQEKLQNFNSEVFCDVNGSLDKLESEMQKYHSCMLWMQHLSNGIDPDSKKHVKAFKKVQKVTKESREEYEKAKETMINKTKLTSASKNNLVSPFLIDFFHNNLKICQERMKEFNKFCILYERTAPYEFTHLQNHIGAHNGSNVADYIKNQERLAKILEEMESKTSNSEQTLYDESSEKEEEPFDFLQLLFNTPEPTAFDANQQKINQEFISEPSNTDCLNRQTDGCHCNGDQTKDVHKDCGGSNQDPDMQKLIDYFKFLELNDLNAEGQNPHEWKET